jgi:iron-sulfur cluster repair protein YtfE (RIC family)
MTLRTLMQAGPAKVNELFTRLAETSDGALKTREKMFAELKAELEAHTDLEEQHLFPVLRKHAETKELVVGAIRDNKELRAAVAELDALSKTDETFLPKLTELRKAFRQHARDEKKELLPAVQKALSEEQVQGITEKMESTVAEAEQARQEQAEERRLAARHEREKQEQAEAEARQQAAKEHERQEVARRARVATLQATEAVVETVETVNENARQIARSMAGSTQPIAAAPLRTTGLPFWDMWFGMSGLQPSRSVAPVSRETSNEEQVIPLAEEVLTVGKRKVNSGTTRIHRYVVETPVEKQVTLVQERVVVERRKPTTDKVTGEMLTEATFEVVETDEVAVTDKTVRLKEELVVRTQRTERVETVRDTVRSDEVKIEHSRRHARSLRAPAHT